ncbi:uncharacterized protein LOC113756536 [Coffea eugenioides]|uniref:uncharacterized protein LOC113756536 n=1 Tax=Coffea eugenioides TaxID=49369 RepID=UPI000F604580|nr:uncharacterized protein LOC113756536 [Coffea eugenioides]
MNPWKQTLAQILKVTLNLVVYATLPPWSTFLQSSRSLDQILILLYEKIEEKEKDIKRNNDCRNLQESRICKQKSRTPITLKEFFDVDVVASHTTRVVHVHEQKDNTRESLCEIARVPTSNEKGSVPTGNKEVNVTSITFTSEDLLLGPTPHNPPLFAAGYANEQKVNRNLIDGDSAVNILPLMTLKELGIPIDELSNSRLMIQDFNHGGQRALRSLNLEIVIDDMSSRALFCTINSSSMFQELSNGMARSVKADDNPFTEAEAYITDAKFYIKRHNAKDKSEQPLSVDKIQNPKSPSAKGEKVKNSKSKEEVHEETDVSLPNNESVVFRYPPKSRMEQGQSPAIQHETLKGLTLPVVHLDTKKMSFPPLKRSNLLSKEFEVEPDTIPSREPKKEKGYAVENSKFDFGYFSPTPIRIKINRSSSQYIAVEDESSQIADKFQTFHGKENKASRVSVFKSIIPSRMRRCINLVIKCGTELNVREHIVVYTRSKEDDEESVVSCNHIILIDGASPEEEEDAEDAPPKLEKGVKATVDDLKEINLGISEDPCPIYINILLSPDEEKAYIELLQEYQGVFAWTCKEMSGLDPKVAVHHLAVKKGVRPVKQAQRRFRPDLIPLIEIEVNKLIEAGLICEVKYPAWISSIVPVRKKNGQIRISINFKDLNIACPKMTFLYRSLSS